MTKKSFSTKINTVDIEIDGIDYVLKQASAGVSRDYRNKQASIVKLGPNGKPVGFNDIGSVEPFLVSKCLFVKDTDKPVSYNTVCEWPENVVREIYDDIREMSNLKEDEEIRQKFGVIFDHPDSPIKMDDLREWASKFQENEDYSAVYEWLQPTTEEKAKNLRPTSALSSE